MLSFFWILAATTVDPVAAPVRAGWHTVERGEGFEDLEIPIDERLEYSVIIDTFLGDLEVGSVTLTSGSEAYNPGLPLGDRDAAPSRDAASMKATELRVGTIQSVARGSYLGYSLHHELDVRHLPQPWPSTIYRDRQMGSEHRQKELKIGVVDGKLSSTYRSDGHCKGCQNPEHFVESAWIWGKPHHCEKCKRADHRVWDPSVTRAIPPGTVDLLSAVYLARMLVRDGGDSMSFPVLDRKKLWDLTVTRGHTKVIEVPKGKFRCAQVQLKTAIPAGEPNDKAGFAGLFGIRGTIRIWMDAATGVPVLISGELPVPVIKDLDLYIKLKSASGTPAGFATAE